MSDENRTALPLETETQQAIREEWCNSCRRPKKEWGPVCPMVYVGDWTHYHSREFWLYRQVRHA